MKRKVRHHLHSAFVIYSLIPLSVWADTKPASKQPADRKSVELLIAALHSTNKDPNPKGLPNLPLPKEFDSAAQEKVEGARRKLKKLGTAAFPVLIEHINDEGYSRSISTSYLRSQSVGVVCFEIIEEQVDVADVPYKFRKGADGKSHAPQSYFSQYCTNRSSTKNGVEKWWKELQNRSLKGMQLEALEWRIQRERDIGFPKEDDRKNYLVPLLKKLEDIRKRPSDSSRAD